MWDNIKLLAMKKEEIEGLTEEQKELKALFDFHRNAPAMIVGNDGSIYHLETMQDAVLHAKNNKVKLKLVDREFKESEFTEDAVLALIPKKEAEPVKEPEVKITKKDSKGKK